MSFRWLSFPPPPVCRGSIVSSLRKGDHVYTGGPAESLKGWRLWCGARFQERFSVSDFEGRKRRRCCSANFKNEKRKKTTVAARRARITVWSAIKFFPLCQSPSQHIHKHTHTHTRMHTEPCAATHNRVDVCLKGSSQRARLRRQRLLFPHWTT